MMLRVGSGAYNEEILCEHELSMRILLRDNDSIPALERVNSDLPSAEPGVVELVAYRHASLLAQIEVPYYFRGLLEPLFRKLNPLIYTFQNLCLSNVFE